MKNKVILGLFLLAAITLKAQPLQLLDRFNGNKLVNDSTIIVFNGTDSIPDITQYFTMKNNTDQTLAVFLRKTVNYYADSTSDYYCFGIRCWPGDDSTNVADSIPPGGEDYTFASHVTHFRRFDMPQPMLPHGISSITYTVYDKATFSEPVEATVTVIYDHTGVGVDEAGKFGEKGKRRNGEGEIFVYPNPATDFVTLEIDENISGVVHVCIFNNLGANVREINYNTVDNVIRLSVIGFKPGLYFGRIVTDQGNRYNFKFQVGN